MLAKLVVLERISRHLSSLDTIACYAAMEQSAISSSKSRTRLRQHFLQVAAQCPVVAAPVMVTILIIAPKAQVAQIVCKITLAPAQALGFGWFGRTRLRQSAWLGGLCTHMLI